MSKQAKVSQKRRLICYDADILELLRGGNSDYVAESGAKVLEWFFMFFFGEKSLKKENGFVAGGRRWAKFDYDDMLSKVNEFGVRVNNLKALQNAIKALENAGLLISISSVDWPGDGKSDGKYYAMRFDKMPSPVKQGYRDHFHFRKHRVQYGLDQWDTEWTDEYVDALTPDLSGEGIEEPDDHAPDTPDLTGQGTKPTGYRVVDAAGNETIVAEIDETINLAPGVRVIALYDDPSPDRSGVARKPLRDVTILPLPPHSTGWGVSPDRLGLYIRNIEDDSFFENGKDSSVSNETVGDAHLEADDLQIDEPQTVFAAIARVVYRKLKITQVRRDAIVKSIGFIQNQEYGGEYIVLDTEMIEDYAIWRVLFDIRGAFPSSINKFEEELPQVFMQWYDSKTYRSPLKNFKQRFPNWRQRLFVGDYGALRQEVQAALRENKREAGTSRNHRSGSVTERHPWKGDDRYRQQTEISTTPELQQAAMQRLRNMHKKAE